MRVVIIPGMGCTPVSKCNWYSWFCNEVKSKHPDIEVILKDFPDPHACRESIWIPFVRDNIGLDDKTVIVGHSSGAACAMRLLEQQADFDFTLKGAILVATAHTDLGDECERRSGYFNRPWDWEKIKLGTEKNCVFHGIDDHLIPVSEARYIANKLAHENFEYKEMIGVSHFFEPWPEIIDLIDSWISMERHERNS
jgi:uncharacterized protein